jgi:hypothetical protein
MSLSFQLRYFFGLIPKAHTIDTAWTELLKMREELIRIGASQELARYRDLKLQVQSDEFQHKKREIVNLSLKNSDQFHLLSELATLEKLKPIRDYFKFSESATFQKINAISQSSQLLRFYELEKIVSDPAFIQRRKETIALRYKGSEEYNLREQFLSLEKNSRLKKYYLTLDTEEYHQFLSLHEAQKGGPIDLNQEDLKVESYRHFLNSSAYKNLLIVEQNNWHSKYEQLKLEILSPNFLEREAFLINRERYSLSADFPIYTEYAELAKSADIQFYLKCINSSSYANYKEIIGSAALERLLELRTLVQHEDFIKQVDFLKNKNRFELTPEFELERSLLELEKSELITTYNNLIKRTELSFFDQWEIVVDENFSDPKLSTTFWEAENYWGSKIAGYSFSQATELQGYQGDKNIEINNQVLSIVTKAEKLTGKAWDRSVGLIPREFDYSSAILNTGNSFRFSEGVIEAKVKFRADNGLTSAFSLTGSTPFPQIDVFRSGPGKVGLGIIDKPENGVVNNLIQIKGLNFTDFHIFRLEVLGEEVVWKINNHEVHRDQLPQNMGDLFLNFIGSIHKPLTDNSLPHHFEIDWVRCLKRKTV